MDAIVTLSTVPAVLALTNLLKGLGLSGKFSALVAVVLGIGLSVADYGLAGSGWYHAAVSGLTLGLGAAGLYDTTKTATTKTASVATTAAPAGAQTVAAAPAAAV